MKATHFSRSLLAVLVACSIVSSQSAMAGPFGIPPKPEDPLLSKVAPEKCLWFLSWAGSATPKADSPNHFEALLAEKEVQQLIKVVEAAIVRAIDEETRNDLEGQAAAREAWKVVRSMIHRPTTIYVSEVKPGGEAGFTARGGLVMHAGDDVELVKKSIRTLHNETPLKGMLKDAEIDGTTWKQFPGDGPVPQVTLGFKGRYLVVGVGEGEAEAILKRAGTPAPKWLADLKKNLAVERPSITGYVNLTAIREMALTFKGDLAEPAKWLGFDKLTSLSTVVGLDGTDTLSRTLVGLDGEPTGLFALAGDKPLALSDLAKIPQDSTFAAAVRMDAKKFVLELIELVGRFDKREQERILDGLQEAEDAMGFSLVDDVLGSLGDVWTAYNSPADGGFLLSGFTGTVSVRDKAKLAGVLDKLLLMAKAQGVLGPVSGRDRRMISVRSIEHGEHRILYIVASDRFFPPVFAPAMCLTDKHLIVSAFPQHIKTFLDRDPADGSLASNPAIAATFKQGAPFKLLYHNTPYIAECFYPLAKFGAAAASRELAREGIDVDIATLPSLPTIAKHLVPGTIAVRRTPAGIVAESRNSIPGDWGVAAMGPVWLGVGLPAVSSTRDAARETVSMNNLRQIGLSMHHHHEEKGSFPARANFDADGKPLLSWRVHILPYLEQEELYKQFKLDEPWDSEHNKKLADRMPVIYRAPTSRAAPGLTTYIAPTGKNAVFSDKEGAKMAHIKDGTSNTIMVFEVSDRAAVPWTKPEDLDVDKKGWHAVLYGPRGRTNVIFCDGSVRRLFAGTDPKTLEALVTRAGGETVDSSRLEPGGPAAFDEGEIEPPAEDASDEFGKGDKAFDKKDVRKDRSDVKGEDRPARDEVEAETPARDVKDRPEPADEKAEAEGTLEEAFDAVLAD